MKVTRTVLTNIELDEKEYELLETEYDVLNQSYPNQTKKDRQEFQMTKTLELLREILNIT
jgi:hypothetical protein